MVQLRRSFGDRELSEDRDGGGGGSRAVKILQLRRSFGDGELRGGGGVQRF